MAGQPIVPRSIVNPVGQTDRIDRTISAVSDSLDETESWLLKRFNEIPVKTIAANSLHANKNRYEYQISIPDLENIIAELQLELDRVPDTYVNQQVVGAYQNGTALAVTNLANISDDYTRNLTQVLMSEPYLRRVALISARVFEEMDGFQGDAGVQLSRILRGAVQDGLNPTDITKSLTDTFGITQRRAETIARTEITGALRRGRWDEAQDANDRLGIKTKLIWLSALSPTTRLWHAQRHGNLYSIQEVREFYAVNGNAINCYLPGTKVSGRFVAGSKAHYSGYTFNIMTADGRNITVTPNHPIMTGRGLIAAAEITEGDYVVAYCGDVENFARVSDLNGNITDSSIENVFGALSDIGHSFFRRVIAVDFHGDGGFMDKGVNIVNIDRVLSCAINPSIVNVLDKLKLIKSYPSSIGNSSFSKGILGMFHSSNSFMSCCGKIYFFFAGKLTHAQKGCLRFISICKSANIKIPADSYSRNFISFAQGENAFPGNMLSMNCKEVKISRFAGFFHWAKSNLLKPFAKSSAGDSNRVCDLIEGLSGLATLDKVIKINRVFYTGHVYDLEEVSGLMVANGIISSNCKCSQSEILVDDDGVPYSDRVPLRLKDQKLKYFGG